MMVTPHRRYRTMKMWNGLGWTYYRRWENFSELQRKRWFEDHPDDEEPSPQKICATLIPPRRAR